MNTSPKSISETALSLLISSILLLSALTGVFFKVVLPLTKSSWNDIISSLDQTLENAIKQRYLYAEGYAEGRTEQYSPEDEQVFSHNRAVKQKAIRFTSIVASVSLVCAFIWIFVFKLNLKHTVIHPLMGAAIVAICYALFSTLFLKHYNTLDAHKATQRTLATVYNSLDPEHRIDTNKYSM